MSDGECGERLSLILPWEDEPAVQQRCEKRAGHRDYHGNLDGYCWQTSAGSTEEQPDRRPCKGVNVNVCVAEGCYGEWCLNVGAHTDDGEEPPINRQ